MTKHDMIYINSVDSIWRWITSMDVASQSLRGTKVDKEYTEKKANLNFQTCINHFFHNRWHFFSPFPLFSVLFFFSFPFNWLPPDHHNTPHKYTNIHRKIYLAFSLMLITSFTCMFSSVPLQKKPPFLQNYIYHIHFLPQKKKEFLGSWLML